MVDSMNPISKGTLLYKEDVLLDNISCLLFIYDFCLSFSTEAEKSYVWEEILGSCLTNQPTSDTLKILCYPRSYKKQKRQLIKHEVSSKSREDLASIISSMCRYNKMPSPSRPVSQKRFLILINPNSGRKTALKIWKQVSEFFEVCETDIRLTEYQGHASEIISSINPASYDGIIAVSGDGIIHEIINTLCRSESLRLVPVGMIPAGTGNALGQVICAAIDEAVTPENCAYICIKGIPMPLDISKIMFQSGKIVHSFLSVTWGFIADVDIESEVCRCCGLFRTDAYGLWRIIRLRRYQGRFEWRGENPGCKEGEFTLFMAVNLPYIGENIKAAPLACPDDGKNDIVLMGNVGRWAIGKAMLSLNSGNHINCAHLNYFKTDRWSLNPAAGIYSIDWERYDIEPIEVEVLNKYSRIIMIG